MLAVALAVVLAAVDPTPSEVHLAYGDEFSSVTVSWATVTPSQSPHVTYGTDTCSGDTVNAQVMAMNTSADRMTYLYNAVITGLSPDTEYRYCVAGEGVALPPVSIRSVLFLSFFFFFYCACVLAIASAFGMYFCCVPSCIYPFS